MGIFAASGTTIAIGGSTPPETFDAAGYAALTYTSIGKLESGGSLGDATTPVTFDDLADKRTLVVKGQRSAGNMELVIGLDDADTGQTALVAAEADDSVADYYFKVTFANKRTSGGTGAIRYFGAKVMSVREQIDTANNVVKLLTTLAINTKIIRVAST